MRTIRVVVDQLKSWLVVLGRHVCLRDAETDSVGETLSERTGGDFDAVGVAGFGVTGSQRVELTEVLQVVHRELEAQEMKEDILKGASERRL